ncbi:MAG: RDD family protein, partial [Blastocatellia bacterium]
MSMLRSVESRLVQSWQERAEAPALRSSRPALWRRGLAELIDRMFPMPFLAFFFPKWIVVVFLYHLLRDSSPTRRSAGKVIFRLRVVSADDGRKCAWHQAVLRRMGSAAAQSAWCM